MLFVLAIARSRDFIDAHLIPEFCSICICAGLNCFFDTIWTGMDCGMIRYRTWLFSVCWYGFFMSLTAAGFSWYAYTEKKLGTDVLRGKKTFLRSTGFLWLELLFVSLSLLHNASIQSYHERTYHEVQYVMLYGMAYVYVITAAVRSWKASRQEKYLAERDILRRNILISLISAAAVLQFFLPAYPILCYAMVLVVLDIMMMSAESLISIDPLTQLNNRRRFIQSLQRAIRLLKPEETLYMIMLDVDSFKEVNDAFGHNEGDKALITTAHAMMKAARECSGSIILARYGGDEFMASLTCRDPHEITVFENKLRAYAFFDNEMSGARYPLRISIGHMKYERGTGIETLMQKADEALYREKRTHHEERR